VPTSRFQDPEQEHPFAPFVRILGKGRTGSRALSREEARTAFGMILRDEVEAVQIGAFLMLLRVKEETGEELAGFVDACRAGMAQPHPGLRADLDWPSYAGKRHQHPWFILSMLLLTQAGHRIMVHGADGHTAGRLYTEQAFHRLGLPVAADWQQADEQLEQQRLSYLPLRRFCSPLHQLIQLRPLLGLRSPVNTLTRMLNPLRAPCSMQSVFHPAYAALHQQADRLLGQPRALVFKGDSGEVEVKPQADTRVQLLAAGDSREYTLPRTLGDRAGPVAAADTAPLIALWRGSAEDEYGLQAVLATATLGLFLLRPELDLTAAGELARSLWRQRDPSRFD
jgi:anthranilate phosphoribosyltransferase